MVNERVQAISTLSLDVGISNRHRDTRSAGNQEAEGITKHVKMSDDVTNTLLTRIANTM